MQVINITPPGSTVVTAPEQVQCAKAEPCRTDGILAVQGSGSNIIKGGTAHFENGNGVTFGVSKNSVTASVQTNYLTTGAASNHTHGPLSLTNLTGTSASNGLSLSAAAPAAGVTAIRGIAGSGASTVTDGTVQFANLNNVSFGLAGSTMTASIPAFLTTAAQSDHTHGNLALTNITGTSASNGLSLSAAASGGGGVAVAGSGASTITSGTLQFANSNGLTFGLNGSTMTASHDGLTAQSVQTQGSVLINGSSGSIVFSNSNNVSFGVNASTITASASFAQSAQPGVAGIAGSAASTATSGVVQFVNSNGVSFGLNGNTMTASVSVAGAAQTGISGIAGSGASTVTVGTVQFANANNVSFGLAGSTMTASIPAIPAAATGVTSLNASAGQLSIAGSGLNSVSNNNSTIVVSARSESLNEIQDPAGDKNFNMGSYGVNWKWVGAVSTNATRDGAFELDAQGNFDGDLVHIHQHVGAPNPADLLHLEAAHTNVTLLRLNAAATVAAEANAPIKWTSGSVPLILGTSQSNVVSNLNAFYLQGKQSSDFLTAQSAQPAIAGIAGSAASTVTAGTVQFANSNSLSFGLNGNTMTGSVSFPAQTSLNYSNSNNVSFGINGSTLTATATFNQTVQPAIAGIAGSAASTVTGGTVQFANSNNMTFGLNGSTMTASFSASVQPGNLRQIGNSSTGITSGTIQFYDSNGVTFGCDTANSRVTASVSQAIRSIGASAGSSITSGLVQFYDSNGVTFGCDTANSRITASVSQAIRRIADSAGNLFSSGSVTFYDTLGGSWSADTVNGRMLFSWAGPRGIAGSAASTVTNGTLQFANSNNVSFGLNASTMTASIPAVSAISGIAGSAASTVTNGTLVFSNLNGVSFGLNGSTMSASVIVGPSGIAGSAASTVTSGTVQFGNANNMSFGLNGSTMTGSFVAPSAIADSAASSVTAGVVQFQNLNGVSFGLNGSTMTASIPAGAGANITVGYWQNFDDGPNTTIALSQGSFSFQRVMIPAYMTATQLDYLMHISGAASQGLTVSQYVAIYTMANRTSANRASSTSGEIRYNSTSGGNNSYTAHSGTRYRSITMAGWNISPGDYIIGFCISTATGQTAPSGITVYGRGQLSLNAMAPTGDVTNFIDRGYYNGATSGNANLVAGASPTVTQTGSVVLAQPWIRMMS